MKQTNMCPLKLKFNNYLESQLLPLGIYYKINLRDMIFSVLLKQINTPSMLIAKVIIEDYDYRGIESPLKYATRKAQEHFDQFVTDLLDIKQ